jgi:hypothetical protein
MRYLPTYLPMKADTQPGRVRSYREIRHHENRKYTYICPQNYCMRARRRAAIINRILTIYYLLGKIYVPLFGRYL